MKKCIDFCDTWVSDRIIYDKNSKLISVKDNRSPFIISYGSIIHFSQFRRLSRKTQVHLNPQNDYVRNRMIHSLECTNIVKELGRYFCKEIFKKNNEIKHLYYKIKKRDLVIDIEDLSICASLLHDIGQAPFGHKGAEILNTCANSKGCDFDDNRQNIRLLIGSEFRESLKVACSIVDAVAKYKNKKIFLKNAKYPPCYDEEKDVFKKINNITNTLNVRNPICYLMECSDDIVNISSDIEDYIKDGSRGDYNEDRLNIIIEIIDRYGVLEKSQINDINVKGIKNKPRKIASSLIKFFLKNSKVAIDDFFKNADTYLFEYIPKKMDCFYNSINDQNILFHGEVGSRIYQFKKNIYDVILNQKEKSRTEIIANKIIKEIWEALWNIPNNSVDMIKNPYFNLLPDETKEHVKIICIPNKKIFSDREKARIICDYISGMTDRYAIKFWNDIYNPERCR